MDADHYKSLVASLTTGKKLPSAIYRHRSLLEGESTSADQLVLRVADALKIDDWNIAKFFRAEFRVSFLNYPDFENAPYPALKNSITVDLATKTQESRAYDEHGNPPILHRKELMVSSEHPSYEEFSLITTEGENAGLYANTSVIGHRQSWEFLVSQKGYEIVDGRLFRSSSVGTRRINRERTAISRFHLSTPFQAIAKVGYLDGQHTVLDYGCGRGDDMDILEHEGIDVIGWDPNHRPAGTCAPRDIVNLGFVINVIEQRHERDEALIKAFDMARKLLLVSAMIASERQIEKFEPYKDGVITSRNTFQKYYTQQDLRDYINETLNVAAIPIAAGVFGVFKDEDLEFEYLSKKYHRQKIWSGARQTRQTKSERLDNLFNENIELFEEFWQTTLAFGRFPKKDEFDRGGELNEIGFSEKEVQRLALQNFDENELRESEKLHQDSLVLTQAMSSFFGRQTFKDASQFKKNQIRHFFKNYSELKERSTRLLKELGDTNLLQEDIEEFTNKDVPHFYEEGKSLTLHKQYAKELPLRLQAYIECASILFGDVDTIQLLKIHIHTGKLSFLGYEGFESVPIPKLTERVKVNLWHQKVAYYDYVGEYKPKPLYWKSIFMSKEVDDYKKQKSFDEKLDLYGLAPVNPSYGMSFDALKNELSRRNMKIKGYRFYEVPTSQEGV